MRGVALVLAVVLACCAPGEGVARAQGPAGGRITALLHALKNAPDGSVAHLIKLRVRALWTEAGSPAAVLLEQRGVRDLVNHADQDALRAFDAALVIDPGYAACYGDRAIARFRSGDIGGAIADIEAALRHDPRMFTVFDTLSRIAEARGDWRAALLAWRRYAEADPKGEGVQVRLKELESKALGLKS